MWRTNWLRQDILNEYLINFPLINCWIIYFEQHCLCLDDFPVGDNKIGCSKLFWSPSLTLRSRIVSARLWKAWTVEHSQLLLEVMLVRWMEERYLRNIDSSAGAGLQESHGVLASQSLTSFPLHLHQHDHQGGDDNSHLPLALQISLVAKENQGNSRQAKLLNVAQPLANTRKADGYACHKQTYKWYYLLDWVTS